METGTKGVREFALDNLIVATTQLLMKLRGLLALPLIVKSLGTEAYGLWAQVLAVVTFGGALLGANLHLALVRFVAGNASDPKRVYSTTLLCSLLLGVLGTVLMLPVAAQLSGLLLGGPEHAMLLRASAVLVILHNVRNLNVNLYRATRRFVVRSAVDFSSVMLELVGILLVLRSGYGLREVVLFMLLWNGLVVAATTVHGLFIVGLGAPTLDLARQALRYALPLVPGAAAWWAIERSDRLVIGHYLGPRDVGIYSAAYALGVLVLHYQAPFLTTLMPRVAEYWDTDRQRAKRYIEMCTKVFLVLAIPTVIGMPIVAPLALRSLANDEIARGSSVVATVVAAGTTLQGLAIMQTQIFLGAKRTGATSAAMVVAATFNVVMTVLLVPVLQILGAAVATLVGYLLLWGILVYMARSVLRVDLHLAVIAKCVVAALLMTALLWYIRPQGFAMLLLALAPAVALYFGSLWAMRVLSSEERAALSRLVSRSRA